MVVLSRQRVFSTQRRFVSFNDLLSICKVEEKNPRRAISLFDQNDSINCISIVCFFFHCNREWAYLYIKENNVNGYCTAVL